MQVVGVDGCRQGWVAVALDDGAFGGAALFPSISFAGVLEAHPAAVCLGVDIPIGLCDQAPRPGEREAKRLLGRRASTLFFTPPRAVLEAPSYADARRVAATLGGSGVSAQAYALAGRILEVDGYRDRRLVEVHPEVSFTVLAGGHLSHSKKTWAGQAERTALLAGAGIHLPADAASAGAAAPDDLIDAAVVAWSAARVAAGIARTFPDPPHRTPDGRIIAIHA